MSEFKFSCPECGQHILCDTSYSGAQIDCPICQKPIVVPPAKVARPIGKILIAASVIAVLAAAAFGGWYWKFAKRSEPAVPSNSPIAVMKANSTAVTVSEPSHPLLEPIVNPVTNDFTRTNGDGIEAIYTADTILSKYTEKQFLDFVPHQSPRSEQYGGFAPVVVQGDKNWLWNQSSPNQITSIPSGTVFPNDQYEMKTQDVEVLSGKTVGVPYYAAANGHKSLVFALIDANKRTQLRRFLESLSAAYVQSGNNPETRNDAYARRVAVALDDWANYVPDYFMTEGWNINKLASPERAAQLQWKVQRAGDFNGFAHEWEDSDIFSFDAIYDSKALDELSKERGYDVRQHIKDGLFFNIGDYFVKKVPVSSAIEANLSGPYKILAKTARVLNRPDYIIWLDDYLQQTVQRKIDRDGVLGEGASYSTGYGGENMAVAREVQNYFLNRPTNDPQLLAVSNHISGYISLLQYGIDQWDSARLPNGMLAAFGDTTFGVAKPRNAGSSALLAAYGHVAIGTGSGNQAVQINQSFSDEANHMHADVTAFVLWAMGNEMLGDVRYYHGPGRMFDNQTLSQNAVTIDRTSMSRSPWDVGNVGHAFSGGNLTLYEPGTNGLAVTEIDGQRAYANKASRYQRIMILNSADADHPYVVDIFRVSGGTMHDYTLHGAISWDQTAECSFPLTPDPAKYPLLLEKEKWVEPKDQYQNFPFYGFFRDVSEDRAPGSFQITFRDTDATQRRDLRLWMTDDGKSEVFLGKTPNHKRADNWPDNPYSFWRPSLIVRRQSDSAPLESLFVSVVEPMNNGVSAIQSVERLPVAGNSLEAVALRVKFLDGRTDTYLVNLANPKVAGVNSAVQTVATADGQFSLAGRIGALMENGNNSRVWTIAASDFHYKGNDFAKSDSFYSGNILGATRKADGAPEDALITDTVLPEGDALRGRQLSLIFDTYQIVNRDRVQKGISEMFEIDHVLRTNGQTYICMAHDHQLEITNATTTVEQVAPQRTFTGTNQFEIDLSASTEP